MYVKTSIIGHNELRKQKAIRFSSRIARNFSFELIQYSCDVVGCLDPRACRANGIRVKTSFFVDELPQIRDFCCETAIK